MSTKNVRETCTKVIEQMLLLTTNITINGATTHQPNQ